MVLTLPPHVCACIDQLEQAGFEAWAVGGCVRDLLRGVQPHDYDLTTSALPEETLRLFPHTVPTGITYGTVTVIAQREPLEVTTFRTEEAYHDFRRPSGVLFASRLEQDLARRDFTVNAMAYAPSRGLTDLFGGQHDLETHVIRAVEIHPTVLKRMPYVFCAPSGSLRSLILHWKSTRSAQRFCMACTDCP